VGKKKCIDMIRDHIELESNKKVVEVYNKKILTQTIQSKKEVNSLEKVLLIQRSSTVNPLY